MKKLSKKTLALGAVGVGALALVGGSAVVMAKSHGDRWGNHWGGATKHIEWMIEQIDTNADGSVTREEVTIYQTDRFGKMDGDSDGSLTPNEFSEGLRRIVFERMDIDGNGSISESEFLEVSDGIGKAGRAVHRMDENGDGQLAQAELSAKLDRWFTRLDKDEDGVIAATELERLKSRRGRH